MEYVARVLAQIPPPRKHLVRYHGYYSTPAKSGRGVSISLARYNSPIPPAPMAAITR